MIGNIVYDALRRKLSIAWRMDADDARALAFGALLADGGMDIAALDAALDRDKFAPEVLEQPRRVAWESRDVAEAPAHVQADVPEWCALSLKELFGARWIEEGKALATRPPVDLRVNSLKAKPEQTLAALEKPALPLRHFWHRHCAFRRLKRWAVIRMCRANRPFSMAGSRFRIWGHSSPRSLPVPRLANRYWIIALELVARHWLWLLRCKTAVKFTPMMRNAPDCRRCMSDCSVQGRNTQVHGNLDALDSLKGQMDLVLTDAPCTGSGTWRRRPDAKWRLNDQQLERRVQDQKDVLESAKQYVKPGGRLAYVTCSLFAEENTRQVARFLTGNADFSEVAPQAIWDTIVADAGEVEPVFPSHGAVFSPLSTGTDGFYVSILQRLK